MATGVGILTLALFALAIPMVLLTIVAVPPFALPFIAVAAIAALLTGAWLAVRAASRGIRWLGRDPGRPGVRRGQADLPNLDAPHSALGDTAATRPSPS